MHAFPFEVKIKGLIREFWAIPLEESVLQLDYHFHNERLKEIQIDTIQNATTPMQFLLVFDSNLSYLLENHSHIQYDEMISLIRSCKQILVKK